MSAEARMQQLIDDAVRTAVRPLERAVAALSARLAAVESSGGPADAAPAKRAAGSRTAKAKAQPAEATATADEPAEKSVPEQRKSGE